MQVYFTLLDNKKCVVYTTIPDVLPLLRTELRNTSFFIQRGMARL